MQNASSGINGFLNKAAYSGSFHFIAKVSRLSSPSIHLFYEVITIEMNKPSLQDSLHRRLTYLRLSITQFCNFKCEYCLPSGFVGKRPSNELNLAEIDWLVNYFAQLGTQKIRLSGGEPTLRRDLPDIIHLCQQTAGIKTVAMTSNGWKLQPRYRTWIDAGLQQLNLSIDSLDPQQFHQITGINQLHNTLRGIDSVLSDGRLRVKINAVLMRQQQESQLKDALRYIKDRPLTWRFIELMQTSEHQSFFEREHLSADTLVQQLRVMGWEKQTRNLAAGPAVEYANADYKGKIGVIAPYSKDFCATCNRLRVTATGQLHLCLFDKQAFDIRAYLNEGKAECFVDYLQSIMPQKPSSHHLLRHEVRLIRNLSTIGG